MNDERSGTLAQQWEENWALQEMTGEAFVQELLDGQPYIPHYFSYAVGYCILEEALPHTRIYDLSDDVKKFQ